MSLISYGSIFIINSTNRVSGTDGNFDYIINIPKGQNYDSVVMLQAMIPKSYYMIPSGSNTFQLLENGITTTITITPGNYNARSFATLIGALMTSNSSQGWTYTISFPNSATQVDTGKFTFLVSGNNSQPSLIMNSACYEQFGLANSSTNTFINNSLTSTNVVKFQNEDTLLIHSNISYNNDQSAYNDVIQEIYCSSTPPFTNVTYSCIGNVEAYSKTLLSENNNTYHFSITDENNKVLDLNGLNCVFTILIYKREDLAKAVKTYFARTVFQNKLDSKLLEEQEQPQEEQQPENDPEIIDNYLEDKNNM